MLRVRMQRGVRPDGHAGRCPSEDSVKLKVNDQGQAVLQDGMPVYVHEDGREAPFDAAKAMENIRSLRGEAQRHREAKEAAEGKLKSFEGIEDPAKAREALETVSKLDAKKLIDAGQVDTVRAEVNKAWESKYSEAEKRANALEQQLHNEIVGGSFARSKFIAEKMTLPPDLAQSAFGRHFKVENGRIKSVDADGKPIFSRKNPGAEADFEESLEIIVDNYPRSGSILKGDNRSGSGAAAGGGGSGGGKSMTRAAFEALDPASKASKVREGVAITD